jgi:pimeloyl-ACP methyl ester carboxylesterase
MTTTLSTNESMVTVGGNPIQMFSGGSGMPLLYLHGSEGNPGWQPYHENLAQRYRVYAPSTPGFNGTPRPPWVRTISDVAHFNLEMVQQLGLEQYILAGSSMGGWVAAEMAAMGQANLKALVLIDAAGIRPEQGEIAEILMVSAQTRAGLRFHDPSQVPNYEEYSREMTPEESVVDHANREMASRLFWKPYLHNPNLPFYLAKVRTPTLLVWGRQDAILPVECGDLYRRALSNSTLKVIENCGHSPQIEKPQEFQAAITEFLSGLG